MIRCDAERVQGTASTPRRGRLVGFGMRAFPLVLLLAACPSTDDSEFTQADADDFADRLAEDIADMAATAPNVVRAAEDLTARDTASECFATVGTCTFCYDVDGTPLTGTFSMAMESTPCGVAWELAGRTLNYAVEETSLSGSWAATGIGGDYTIEATGERSATLSTSSARGGLHEFDSSFAIEMTAEVVDHLVASLALTLEYSAFTTRAWTADITGDADGVSGTATSDDGISCSVSGGYEAPNVSCTLP
jgi:hypothetical protein